VTNNVQSVIFQAFTAGCGLWLTPYSLVDYANLQKTGCYTPTRQHGITSHQKTVRLNF